MLKRRTLLAATLLVPVAACTTTSSNGVTTITLDVNKFDAWGVALANGASLVATLPGIVGTPAATIIQTAGTILTSDLAALNQATGGSISLSFDANSVPAAVASLEADAAKLLNSAKVVVSGAGAAVIQTAQTYIAAIETLVSLMQAAVGSVSVGVAASATPKMAEAKAMAVLSAPVSK